MSTVSDKSMPHYYAVCICGHEGSGRKTLKKCIAQDSDLDFIGIEYEAIEEYLDCIEELTINVVFVWESLFMYAVDYKKQMLKKSNIEIKLVWMECGLEEREKRL